LLFNNGIDEHYMYMVIVKSLIIVIMNSTWNQYNELARQEAKAKAEQWYSYRHQLLNSGRDDLVKVVEFLADLGIQQSNYEHGTDAGVNARIIGEEINRAGGFRMMQDIHQVFVCALYAKTDYTSAAVLSRRLELAWDGIGDWLG
jgi:hypothetical protein